MVSELVVGDIYEFHSGMRIPADSVILEVSEETEQGIVECNEGDVTGNYSL